MTQRPNLSHGRGYLAIPGPSVMPEAVLQAMHRPAPNIYEGELVDMMPGIDGGPQTCGAHASITRRSTSAMAMRHGRRR